MQLMTKEIEEEFAKQGDCSEKEAKDVRVIVKYFNPAGAGTWFATEYNPKDRVFFGYVNLIGKDCAELGSFSLDELQEFKGKFGLGIERDLHFSFHTLQEVMDKY